MEQIEKDYVQNLVETVGEEAFNKFKATINYSPVIAFFGKTGVGKSSLCNALFGESLFEVDDVYTCTREPQIESSKERRLTLVDVPGIGEDTTKSIEYKELYKRILTEGVSDKNTKQQRKLDAVVWLIKADDKALKEEHDFFETVFKPFVPEQFRDRVIFAVSQADKMEPSRGAEGWDEINKVPGGKQRVNLSLKTKLVAEYFDQESNHVIDFSANEGYQLDKLFDRIVNVVPKERVPLLVEVVSDYHPVYVSEKTKEKAKNSFWNTLYDVASLVTPIAKIKPIIKVGKKLFKGIKILFKLF